MNSHISMMMNLHISMMMATGDWWDCSLSPDTSVGDSIAGHSCSTINYVSLVNIQPFFHIDIHCQIFGQNISPRAVECEKINPFPHFIKNMPLKNRIGQNDFWSAVIFYMTIMFEETSSVDAAVSLKSENITDLLTQWLTQG